LIAPAARSEIAGRGGQRDLTSPKEKHMTNDSRPRPIATGGLFFASVIMVLAGIFQIFQGIAALAKDHVFVATPNYLFKFDTTAWGWIHLVIGVVVGVLGYFVLYTTTWARVVGIAVVGLQMFSNFFFLPYYPFWAMTIIALDVFVIWVLAIAPTRDEGPSLRTAAEMDDLTRF
jgi:hypothetical protein